MTPQGGQFLWRSLWLEQNGPRAEFRTCWLDGQFGFGEEQVHASAEVIIAHHDQLINEAAAQVKAVLSSVRCPQAVSDRAHRIDLLW